MSQLSRRDLMLLVLLHALLGRNWPVMNSVLRNCRAFLPLDLHRRRPGRDLGVGRCARDLAAGSAGAWPTIVKLALPNVIVWHLLAILAIKMLPSGRAAILGYTMPVWAVVFGLLLFNERPLPRHWVGVLAAAIGIVLLLGSELTSLASAPLGTLLMLTAAAAWGYGTHLIRST